MEKETNVMRLSSVRKKGLLRIVFSRLLLIVLLMAAQVWLVVLALSWASRLFPHYAAAQIIFTVCMILYLYNSGTEASSKLTWMWLIALFPLVGAGLLLFTRLNIGNRMIHRRMSELIEETASVLPVNDDVLGRLAGDPYGSDDLCRYLNHSGCFPIYENTQTRYFSSGEDAFDAILQELEKAEKTIFLESFIIEEGYMWGRVLDILCRKAEEGVDVRVMYDGMCEISHLPYGYAGLLEARGIRAKAFARVTPFVSTHYNYRDHRKIVVIDGKVAFTGGINFADEYINRVERFGHWKDAAIMLRGEAARSFLLMFLQMWSTTEKEPDFSLCAEPAEETVEAEGVVMPYADCPLDAYRVGENVYIDMLYRANTYVHIMTPYLILDDELESAFLYAAQRGVDVKIILPGIPDKKTAYALAKSHYRTLTEAGVQLFEYTPGFVHSKVCVSDDCRAVVGSINFDYRSLYHHFECAAYLYRTPCVADIEADIVRTLEECRAVTPETIRHEKLLYRILGGLLKLVAPLM